MLPPGNTIELEEAVSALNKGDITRALDIASRLRFVAPSPQAAYIELMAMISQRALRGAQRLLDKSRSYLQQWPEGAGMAAHVQGRIYLSEGKPEMAVPLLREAAERLGGSQGCILDYAESLFRTRQYVQAHGLYLRALRMGPATEEIYNNLMACALRLNLQDQAFAYQYVRWKKYPSSEQMRHVARVMLISGEVWEAVHYYKRASGLGEALLECYHGLAECYRRLGYMHRVIRYLERALPLAAPAQENGLIQELGHAYERTGNARAHMERAERNIENNPNNYHLLLSRAYASQVENDFAEALRWCDRAESVAPGHPDMQYFRGYVQLLEGNWDEGWKNYEARWKTTAYGERYRAVAAPLASPMWDGKADLKGEVVMALCEQGAGDIIQFCLYARNLVARGATVDIMVPPFMTEVMSTVPWIRGVHDNYFRIPPHDYHVSLMSMPLHEGTRVATIPTADVPYLTPPRTRPRFSKRFTVGIVWSGDPRHLSDPWRSMKPTCLYKFITSLPEVQFVSLQMPPHHRVIQKYMKAGLMIDGMENAATLTDTAAAMHACDLVIAVDTMAAHLAAAMHKPVWLLLSEYADWRWLGAKTTTRWYPTMTLYRQKKMHDWTEVLSRVAKDVCTHMKSWAVF